MLGATHIVESGRMGGMQLTHYHHFGFALVSFFSRAVEPPVGAAANRVGLREQHAVRCGQPERGAAAL